MNILRMIRLAIAFVIIFTFILIIRWTVLPHLKVFFHALPPAPLWEGIWSAIIGAGMQIMPFILAAFVIIYFLYKIISKIPLIGKIILKIPPFPEFKRSGLIGLFDGVFGIIFSRDSIPKRFQRLAYAIGAFIEANFKFAADTTDEVLGITPMINKINSKITSAKGSIENSTYKLPTKINLTNGKGAEDIKDPPDPYANQPNPILNDEQREVDDKYQLCISENMKPIPPISSNMSKKDLEETKEKVAAIQQQNKQAQLQCKVQKLQTTLAFLTNKFT